VRKEGAMMPGSYDTLLSRVRETLEAERMLAPGDRVLVAVSGGADSVALLHALRALGHALEVAHFDHQTRNGASGHDAAFVGELASILELPFHGACQPVEAEALAASKSFEQHARDLRYAFLLGTAREQGCAALATGHQADDLAETVLLRMLRGTGPSGLAGIPPVREQDGVRIIRPLIACTREAIHTWLTQRGLPWREDHSNTDTRYLRNRIRHELLPHLCQQYNPRLREALLRLAELQRGDNGLLDPMAEAALERCLNEEGALARPVFAELPKPLRRRVVLRYAWRHGVDCPFERVAEAAHFIAEAPAGRYFEIGGGVTLCNGRTHTAGVPRDAAPLKKEVALDRSGVTDAFGRRFTVRMLDALPTPDLAAYCTPGRQVFDADALGPDLLVRTRRPGDRFVPLGMKGTKKLKEYFVDIGLPAQHRGQHPLVVAGGRIVWVVGHAMSAHAAVTQATRRVLEIEVAEAEARPGGTQHAAE